MALNKGYLEKETSIIHTKYTIDDSQVEREQLKLYSENIKSSVEFLSELLDIPLTVEFSPGMWILWTMEMEDNQIGESRGMMENLLESNAHLLR